MHYMTFMSTPKQVKKETHGETTDSVIENLPNGP